MAGDCPLIQEIRGLLLGVFDLKLGLFKGLLLGLLLIKEVGRGVRVG